MNEIKSKKIKDISKIKVKGLKFSNLVEFGLFKVDKKNEELTKKMCVIYGQNGSGKTTISRAFNKIKKDYDEKDIKEIKLYDINNEEFNLSEEEKNKIHIFNEKYIENNIRWCEDGLLNTIVTLGEQKELDDKINNKKKELDKVNADIKEKNEDLSPYQEKKNINNPNFYLEKMKKTLKHDKNWVERYFEIFKERKNITSDIIFKIIKYKNTEQRDVLESGFDKKFNEFELARNNDIKINQSIKIDNNFSFRDEDFIQLIGEKIEKPFLNDREKSLMKLLSEKNKDYLLEIKSYFLDDKNMICPYCTQFVSDKDKKDLVLSIENILNELVKKHQEDLKKIKLEENPIRLEHYEKLDKHFLEEGYKLLKEYNEAVKIVNDYIDKKVNDPYKNFELESFNIELKHSCFQKYLKDLEELRIKHNEKFENLELIKKELHEINCQIAFHDIKEDLKTYDEQMEKCELIETKLRELEGKSKTINQEISYLEKQKKNISIPVDFINQGLNFIFFSNNRLSIKLEDNKYQVLSRGEPIQLDNISTGERNVIALCYFFASIMKDKNGEKFYENEYLLIIDDPISSFDISNRMGITSYLRMQFESFINEKKETKIILMTHELQTLYDIKYFFQKEDLNIFELVDNNINKINLRGHNEYSHLITQIYKFASEDEDCKIDETNIGNSIRRVLEAFTTFNYKTGIEGVLEIGNIMEDKYKQYFKSIGFKLFGNNESHFEQKAKFVGNNNYFQNISYNEKCSLAKSVICFLYKINENHILKHISTKKNLIDNIEGWIKEIEKIIKN